MSLPFITNLSDNLRNYNYQAVPLYEKFEISFQISNLTAENPFFPYDSPLSYDLPDSVGVTVDTLFLPPGETNWGNAYIRPAFYFQPTIHEYEASHNPRAYWIYPVSNAFWSARFTPTKSGRWHYKIRIQDKEICQNIFPSDVWIKSETYSFDVDNKLPDNHGFVIISPYDTRYFQFQDNTAFNCNGYNGGVTGNLTSICGDMYSNNVDVIRLWMINDIVFSRGTHGWDPWRVWKVWNEVDKIYEAIPDARRIWKYNEPLIPYSNHDFAIKIQGDGDHIFSKWDGNQELVTGLEANKIYRLRLRVKYDNIVPSATGTGQKGLIAKFNNFTNYTNDFNYYLTTNAATGSSDWTWFESIFTNQFGRWNLSYLTALSIGLQNVDSGTVYLDEIYIGEELGDNKIGPNIVFKGQMNYHYYYDQISAAKWDLFLEEAHKFNVYLKPIVVEKQDNILTAIPPYYNFHTTEYAKVRSLHKYWFRYLSGRWGYSPNIFAWELCNEDTPGSGESLAIDFHNIIKKYNPFNLTTTSFWSSFSETYWRDTVLDIADVHSYLTTIENTDETLRSKMRHDAAFFRLWESTNIFVEQHVNKPVIRGESGIDYANGANIINVLSNDLEGIWFHNFQWAGLNFGGLYDHYWYNEHFKTSYYDHRDEFYKIKTFLNDIDLFKGGYTNWDGTCDNLSIRIVGQKNVTKNRFHLWIQNTDHTWTNSVYNNTINNQNGTITFTGFTADQIFDIQYWDTWTGTITNTIQLTADGIGTITIPVSNLYKDFAIKAYPQNETLYTAQPIIFPPSGNYYDKCVVYFDCLTSDAQIRYTLNNTDVDSNSTLYSGSFTLGYSAIIKAKAFKSGLQSSTTASNNYFINIKLDPPEIKPAAGIFNTSLLSVSLSSSVPGTRIYYTTNGNAVNQSSALYTNILLLNNNASIKARAYKTGHTASETSEADYTLIKDSSAPLIQSAVSPYPFTEVIIYFNEKINRLSAHNTNNFSIDNGIIIYSSEIQTNKTSIKLNTSQLSSGITYTITINNLKDLAIPANIIAADSQCTFEILELNNAVVNGNFESGHILDFATQTAYLDSSAAYDGTFGIKVSNTGHISQNVASRLLPDIEYIISAYIKVTKESTSGWGAPVLCGSLYNNLGTFDFGSTTAVDSIAQGWQYLEFKRTFTSSELSGNIYLGINNWGFNGILYADDLFAFSINAPTPTPTPIPTPISNIIANYSFETGTLASFNSQNVLISSSDSHHGTYCAQISNDGAYVSQSIKNDLLTNKYYIISVWVKIITEGGSWGSPRLRLSHYSDLGSVNFGADSASDNAVLGWQYLTFETNFTVNDIATAPDIIAGVRHFGFPGVSIADELIVNQCETPTSTPSPSPTASPTATPVITPSPTTDPGVTPTPPIINNIFINGNFENLNNFDDFMVSHNCRIISSEYISYNNACEISNQGFISQRVDQRMQAGREYLVSSWIKVTQKGQSWGDTRLCGSKFPVLGTSEYFEIAALDDDTAGWQYIQIIRYFSTEELSQPLYVGISHKGMPGTSIVDDIKIGEVGWSTTPTPTPTPNQLSNIIPNGNFENGNLTGYNYNGVVAISADFSYEGYYGIQMSGRSYISREISAELTAGVEYTFSANIKIIQEGGSWGSPRISASSNQNLYYPHFNEAASMDRVSEEWQYVEFNYTFNASELSEPVYIGINNSGFRGIVNIDNLFIKD